MREKKRLLQFSGTIEFIGALQTSQKGTPYRQVVIVLDGGGIQDFCVFKETAQKFDTAYKSGTNVTVAFSLDSREWQDKNGNTRRTPNLNLVTIDAIAPSIQTQVTPKFEYDDINF